MIANIIFSAILAAFTTILSKRDNWSFLQDAAYFFVLFGMLLMAIYSNQIGFWMAQR